MFFSTLSRRAAVSPPAALTEFWQAGIGMFQDSGMTTPVTADGQTVAKWVGAKASTVLTCANTKARLVGGVLCPQVWGENSDGGHFALPSGFAHDRRNLSILMHCQRPGSHVPRPTWGMGTARFFEHLVFNRLPLYAYDGTTSLTIDQCVKMSACTLSMRSNASGLKVGTNGVEATFAAFAAGTDTGGKFFSLHDTAVSGTGNGIAFGIGIGPYLSDSDYAQALAWMNGLRARPSEVSPPLNIGVYGDSQTEGVLVDGRSWMFSLSHDYPTARIIPVVGSGQYFSYGGSPMNFSTNTVQLDLERKAGAGRNILIYCVTNDPSFVDGPTYAAALKSHGQARMTAGWEVYPCKLPDRSGVSWATYRTNVAALNSAIDADPWYTGKIDLTPLASYLQVDGVHWTQAGQAVAYGIIKTALGI